MNESDLNIITGIAEAIFFVTLSVLAVYLIISLKKFLASISKIENEVIEISGQMAPVISDMKFITEDFKEIAEKARFQFKKIEDVSENVISKGQSVVNTLDTFQLHGKNLMDNGVNFISAITNGYRTFKRKLTVNSYNRNKSVI